MKRKMPIIFLIFAALSLVLISCGNGEEETAEQEAPAETEQTMEAGEADYADGFYFNQAPEFDDNGWKSVVTLEVENGQITSADFESVNRADGPTKTQRSEDGTYGMVANSGATVAWYEQIADAEQYLLDNQVPMALSFDDEGKTDAISGVSITVEPFFSLAHEALTGEPTGRGPYEDGSYSAEADSFSNGWKSTVDITVFGGYIVAAYWDAIPEEGEMNKREASLEGEYGMVENSDAQSHWYEQARKVEAHLMETQDPAAIEINDEGKTDAISGVSITVSEFFSLAQEALEEAQ